MTVPVMLWFSFHPLVPDPSTWMNLTDITNVQRIWLTPCLDEVYDIQWSPDSTNIIAGAINARVGLSTDSKLQYKEVYSYM